MNEAVPAFAVSPVDSLGAGDSFMASLLYMIVKEDIVRKLNEVTENKLYDIFKFAHAAGAIATLKRGAIPSLPGVAHIEKFIRDREAKTS